MHYKITFARPMTMGMQKYNDDKDRAYKRGKNTGG